MAKYLFKTCLVTACLGAILGLSSPALWAQWASLEGVVKDATGGVLPGVTVTAANDQTGVGQQAVTEATGRYYFPKLQPGLYTVTAERSGFKKSVYTQNDFKVNTEYTLHVTLDLGQFTEVVSVESGYQKVDTTGPTIGTVVDERMLRELPVLGRSPTALVTLGPGISSNSGWSAVNGARGRGHHVSLDGVYVSDPVGPRLDLSVVPANVDSVQEFRLITSGGKAEYGRSAGAQLEMISKSGTNARHGNAFYYHRNTALNANSFFNNLAAATTPDGQPLAKPTLLYHLFGGSLGGPIIQNKAFYFGNLQILHSAGTVSRLRAVPTPEARSGLFRWRAPGRDAVNTFNIFANDPRGLGLDPAVRRTLELVPLPNDLTTGDGLNTAGFRFNNPVLNTPKQFTTKVDWLLRSRHQFATRYALSQSDYPDSLNNADAPFPGQPHGITSLRLQGASSALVSTLTPRAVNEFRYAFQRSRGIFGRPRVSQIGDQPAQQANSFTNPIQVTFSSGRASLVNQFKDNVSYARGTHTVKFGADLRLFQDNEFNDGGIYPNVNFTRTLAPVPSTFGPFGATVISAADRMTFENLVNDLLGRIGQINQTFYSDGRIFQPGGSGRVRGFRWRELDLFCQDDWRVTPRLTLNFGLRWELKLVPFEVNGRQAVPTFAPFTSVADGTFALSGPRTGRKLYGNDFNNWAPRLGFAWDPWGQGRFVIRGSYGIYYDSLMGAVLNLMDARTPGFSTVGLRQPNQEAGRTFENDLRLRDGIPRPVQPGAVDFRVPLGQRTTNVGFFDPRLRTPYTQNFQLGVQREIAPHTVLEADYVGRLGLKLFADLNLNQSEIVSNGFLAAFQELQAGGFPALFGRLFPNRAAAVSALGGEQSLRDGNVGAAANNLDQVVTRLTDAGLPANFLRRYPQFAQVLYGCNCTTSAYHSLQVSLWRRLARGLDLSAHYTFSKSLDTSSADGQADLTNALDNFDLRANRGRSNFDRRHVFNARGVYELPWGASSDGGRLGHWLGGWQLGWIVYRFSGEPFTVMSGRSTGPNTLVTQADWQGASPQGSVRSGIAPGQIFWFTPEQIARFTAPAAGTLGTSARNAFTGPGFFNADLSLLKRIPIREGHHLQLRMEFFNVLNHPNFDIPDTNLLSPSFGRITTTAGDPRRTTSTPRTIQIALRYDF